MLHWNSNKGRMGWIMDGWTLSRLIVDGPGSLWLFVCWFTGLWWRSSPDPTRPDQTRPDTLLVSLTGSRTSFSLQIERIDQRNPSWPPRPSPTPSWSVQQLHPLIQWEKGQEKDIVKDGDWKFHWSTPRVMCEVISSHGWQLRKRHISPVIWFHCNSYFICICCSQ